MKKLETAKDDILDVEYDLYSMTFKELKDIMHNEYKDINFSDFNEDSKYNRDSAYETIIKSSGIICNYFFIYKEGYNYYLLDGFNRLFTKEMNIPDDQVVYVKEITSKLEDNKLMTIMFNFNLWKLSQGHREYDTKKFFDRGFRLLLYKKYGITIHVNENYKPNIRFKNDFVVLQDYFMGEKYEWTSHYGYANLKKIFANSQIINDIKQIIKINDYLEPPFKNYYRFVSGFIMYLNRERVRGSEKIYIFNDYLEELKTDKFFKNLQKRSWTDSTRKAVFRYFNDKYEQEKVKK